MVELAIKTTVPARISPGHIRLSVVIPVYNEEQNISLLCERLMAVLRNLGQTFEVIAVNDGSRDGSLAELNAEGGAEPRV